MDILFQLLCNVQTLHDAWKLVQVKKSSGGVDGVSVEQFEVNLEKHLKELCEELRERRWNPEPYLRVEIRKNETEKRKLGLLTIKDKIVQQAIIY